MIFQHMVTSLHIHTDTFTSLWFAIHFNENQCKIPKFRKKKMKTKNEFDTYKLWQQSTAIYIINNRNKFVHRYAHSFMVDTLTDHESHFR